MRSSSILGYLAIALGLVTPSISSAQYSKDNTSPPIDVPTAPVPQGPAATPPPPTAKPAPKPAAPPPAAPKTTTPTTPTTPATTPSEPAKKDESKEGEGATTPKFNNEGVFKISGTKGAGVVSGTKPKGTKDAAAATKPQGTKAAGKVAKKDAANVAQWPGFRLTEDGGSEVMVEFSSNPSSPTEHRAAGSVTYVFKGAHVIKHNNQNPLLTVHFNTPVASAKLVPKKGELHLVVDMRAGANAAPTMGMRASSDGDGQQFYVKFPSGSWLPKGAENEEIAPAPTQKLKAKGSEKKSDTPPSTTTTAPKTESGGKTGPAP